MKEKIRFLHTADLHLGSALKSIGETSGHVAELLENATFTAMKRICDIAIQEQVDFMVIAGDLYDREAKSIKAGFFLREQFERLAEEKIPVFIIAGNHDPLGEGENLIPFPPNVHIFPGDESQCKEVVNQEGEVIARVIGRSYKTRFERQKIFQTYGPVDDEAWNIALLHTALEAEKSRYLPCTVKELSGVAHIHYWALGHAHSRQIVAKEPLMVYPGIPQGRAPDEQGVGGCLLVELDPQAETELRFIPVSSVVWRVEEVKIDANPKEIPENLEELLELLAQKAEEIIEQGSAFSPLITGYILRWVLRGRGEIHRALSAQADEAEETILTVLRRRFEPVQGSGRPFLWSESLTLQTGLPLPDLADLRQTDETFQELERVVSFLKTDEGADLVAKALGEVWEPEEDEGDYNPKKIQYKKAGAFNSLESFIEEAKELVIEKLLERRTQR